MALWLMARFNQGDFWGTGSVPGWRSHQGCLVEYRFMMIYDLCVIKLMRSVTGFGKGNMELMNSVFTVFLKVFFVDVRTGHPAVPDITGSLHRHSDAWCKTAWVCQHGNGTLKVFPAARQFSESSPKLSEGCSSFRSDVDMIAVRSLDPLDIFLNSAGVISFRAEDGG